jgi:hypothetical protein
MGWGVEHQALQWEEAIARHVRLAVVVRGRSVKCGAIKRKNPYLDLQVLHSKQSHGCCILD